METTEVKQLKINVTNIKSSLINYNKSLISLRKSEKKLVLENVRRQKTLQKEKRIETKITPNALGTIKNTILSRPLSFFDKIKEFFGIVLLGLLINNLPQIIEKTTSAVTKLIEVSSGIINSITTTAASFKNFVTSIPENTKTKLGETKDQLTTLIDELNRMIDPLNKAYTDLEKQLPETSKSSSSKSGPTAGTSETQQKSKGGTIKSDPSATKIITTEKVTSPFSRPGGTVKLKKARQSYNAFVDFAELARGNTENYNILGGTSDTLAEVNRSYYDFIVELKKSWKDAIQPASPYQIPRSPGQAQPPGPVIPTPAGLPAIKTDDIIGRVGYTGRTDPVGVEGSHIHIESYPTKGNSIPNGVLYNILVSGVPMPNQLRFSSGMFTPSRPKHAGLDYAGDPNQPITLIGGLKFKRYIPDQGDGYGNKVIIESPDGSQYTLNHLNAGPENLTNLIKKQEKTKTTTQNKKVSRVVSPSQKEKPLLAFNYDEEDTTETILVMGTQTIIQKEPPIIKTIMVNNNTGSQSSSSPASVSKIWTV